ncbi:DJ-1/PfpI/YhbO family deglycase/protease [Methanotorris formicicus]|uniref:Intracellular protease, PfpI family n=1 Tax=Methanotorris formicicus Mc-S-70 TaxID=647171 RepID=H1KW96_9EURY|nr:DJ-1/PfpI/YhbO family deglycase/protease [Methanotorris formicicus]EHP89679.1 intracellular protease, PfpI family [Methanotorris formicicus Mc-S-70]
MRGWIVFLILMLVICGCINEVKNKTGDNMSVLMVIAPKDFRDEELFEPLQIFESKYINVDVVSTTRGEHIGMLGGKITTSKTIKEVNAKDYDAIVIVGGIGSKEYLWDNEDLQKLVKEFYNDGKVVSAICLSPVVLARAGILRDKKATVFPTKEAIEELKKHGAIYVDEGVVVDGNVVTAKNPNYAKDFGLEVVKLLGK